MEAVLADTSNQWCVLSEAAPYTRRFARVTLAVWSSMCLAFGCMGVCIWLSGCVVMRVFKVFGIWSPVCLVFGSQGVWYLAFSVFRGRESGCLVFGR